MKRFSKLVSLVMVLAMVFSLCGCGNPAKKLYGTWKMDCDLSEVLADEMGDDYADFNCEFPLTILFTFNEDGSFLMSVDKDSLSSSMDKWVDEFIAFNVDMFYDQFEEMGVDKAAADEQIQDQYGCSAEEYLRGLMGDTLDADSLAEEFTQNGMFKVKGKQVFIAATDDNIDNVAGNPYSVTPDTLTIEAADGEETELVPGVEYPLTLNKTK